MIIYEVNLDVDNEIANTCAAWLAEHIREMLELEGFRAAAWYRRDVEETGNASARRHWTIHYHLESRAHLDDYLDTHAERMRQDGTERFGGRLEATRRVLEQREVFSAEHATPDESEEG